MLPLMLGYSICPAVFEVDRGVPRPERGFASALERLDVTAHGFWPADLIDGKPKMLTIEWMPRREAVFESMDPQLDMGQTAHGGPALDLLPVVFHTRPTGKAATLP